MTDDHLRPAGIGAIDQAAAKVRDDQIPTQVLEIQAICYEGMARGFDAIAAVDPDTRVTFAEVAVMIRNQVQAFEQIASEVTTATSREDRP